jgi:hypothetical protein
MRYSIAAAALALGMAFGPAAFAAPGWGTQDNGYGYYHESNGAATGRGTQTPTHARQSASGPGWQQHEAKVFRNAPNNGLG